MTKTRTESDTFGSVEVPADRLWGAQTERSRRNFRIGEERMPKPIIRALGLIKHAAAEINHRWGPLDKKRAQAIARAACEVMDGELDERKRAIATLSGLVGALTLARAVDDPALRKEILVAARGTLGA
jgi:fumarate hydratase class II